MTPNSYPQHSGIVSLSFLLVLVLSGCAGFTPAPEPTATPYLYPTPLPLPIRSPVPTPLPGEVVTESRYVEIAISFVSSQSGADPDYLMAIEVDDFAYDSVIPTHTYVGVINSKTYSLTKVLVDKSTLVAIYEKTYIDQYETALHDKFGPLSPSLYDRLNSSQDFDKAIPVVIWLVNDYDALQSSVSAKMAETSEDAEMAVSEGKLPYDVDDPDVAARLHNEWLRLSQLELDNVVEPIVDTLSSFGVYAESIPGIPAVGATLTAEQIRLVAEQTEVVAILENDAPIDEAN